MGIGFAAELIQVIGRACDTSVLSKVCGRRSEVGHDWPQCSTEVVVVVVSSPDPLSLSVITMRRIVLSAAGQTRAVAAGAAGSTKS